MDQFSENLSVPPDFVSLRELVDSLTASCEGNPLQLLALLRVLEHLHQEVREKDFISSLPNNRQALYALLKDIESQGGWPYIPGVKLRSLLMNWEGQALIPDERIKEGMQEIINDNK
ncbi:MAG: hypothetical protein ACRDB1_05485 [Microcoleaceae cyanobacterium]